MIDSDLLKYAPGKIIILDSPRATGKTINSTTFIKNDAEATLFDNVVFINDYHKIAGYKTYLATFGNLYKLHIQDIHKPKFIGSFTVQNIVFDDIYESDEIIDIVKKYNVINKIIINIDRHKFKSREYGKFITAIKSEFVETNHIYCVSKNYKSP